MAGTTLRGIGDDEEEEAGDSDKTPAASDDQQLLSGPTVVDNAKVAEGLKRLRSLDELPKTPPPSVVPKTPGPVPVPPSTATLMGIGLDRSALKLPGPPAIGSGTLFGIGAPILAGTSLAGPAPATNQTLAGVVAPIGEDEATVPVNAVSGVIEQDTRGTMMGHDRHGAAEAKPEGARVITEKGLSLAEFSGGERRFFESEPINTEFEPEFRANPYARITMAIAVAGVFVAGVWGYVRYRRADTGPTEAQTAPAETPAATAAAPPPVPPPAPAPVAAEPPAPPVAAAPTPAPAEAVTPPPVPVAPTAAAEPAPATTPAATTAPAATPPPTEEPAPPPPPAPAVAETPPPKPTAGLAKLEAKVKESTQAAPPAKPKERPAATATDRPKVAREREMPGEPLPVPTKRIVRPVTSLDGTPAATRPAALPGRESLPVAAGAHPVKPSAPILPATLPPSSKPSKPPKHLREDDPDGTLPLSVD